MTPPIRESTFANLKVGDLFRVKGYRGQFRFVGLVHSSKGQWVEAYEQGSRPRFRAFHLTESFTRSRNQTARPSVIPQPAKKGVRKTRAR